MKICNDCWRDYSHAGENEKPNNWTATRNWFIGRMLIGTWTCPLCRHVGQGYVEVAVPEGTLLGLEIEKVS